MKKLLTAFTLLTFALAAMAEVKVATVDMAKLFDGYGRAKTAEASIQGEIQKLTAETQRRQAEGRAMVSQLEDLGQKYNNAALALTALDAAKKQARELEDKIEARKVDFEKFQAQSRQELMQKEQTQRETIYNEIQRAAIAVARKQGANLIFNTSEKTTAGLPTVVYSDKNWDITAAVLSTLNAGAK